MLTLRTIDTRIFIAAALVIILSAGLVSTFLRVQDEILRQQHQLGRDLEHSLALAGPAISFGVVVDGNGQALAGSSPELAGLAAARLPLGPTSPAGTAAARRGHNRRQGHLARALSAQQRGQCDAALSDRRRR